MPFTLHFKDAAQAQRAREISLREGIVLLPSDTPSDTQSDTEIPVVSVM